MYDIASIINRHVGDLQLIDEKQQTIKIGTRTNGSIVIDVVLNQILPSDHKS